MQIDLIFPQRKGLVKSDFEKTIIFKNTRVIQSEPKIHLPFDMFNKINYMKYVKSRIGKDSIKHLLTDTMAYMLHFIPPVGFVVTCHGINIPILDYFNLQENFFYKFSLKGMEKAERVIAVSNQAKEDVIRFTKIPEDKIHVAHFGIDNKIFRKYKKNEKEKIRRIMEKKYGISDDDKIILNVGSEQPRKNVSTLIKAFGELKKTYPNIKMIKVGPPAWQGAREKLKNLIKQLNLEKSVIFAGTFPNEYLTNFYNVADLFVFPSYSEGFGVPNLEAMACGCPVITTDKTSIPEIVGDAAIKISDPFDYKLLANKMKKVLTEEKLKEEMSRKSLQQARKFSWERYAKEVYSVYEDVWNEKHKI